MFDKERIMKAVREILEAIGEDPDREGLKDTPRRVADMLEEILSGYVVADDYVYFTEKSDLVILSGVRFYSLCEHHLLPFYGTVSLAYLPKGKVLGLSKLVRIVRKYAARLQIQERMTEQIADELMNVTGSSDVMVVVRAKHLCMAMRGVRNPATVITSAVRGEFMKDQALRMEALQLMRWRKL